ncbi:MAG: 3-deoxy-D-manno-octulosonic acid transferase [Xanthomonadales bacterium]|nr:3-deoxy-D-manno-octulosonic acid transferase [Xanthomonadales bacterium]
MYRVYKLASYFFAPLLLLHLGWRSLREPEYRRRWRERFALSLRAMTPGGIVVHAASVGEVNAATPLVLALLSRYPGLPLSLTCFTPTGSARIRALFGAPVQHVYIPLDLPGCVQRFFRHTRPRLLIVMETEIWPNLYHAAAQHNIPILLANARISEKSFPRFQRVRRLVGDALLQVSCIAAQSENDATRFAALGAEPARITVSGNLKFELKLPPALHMQGQALRRARAEQRPVFLAASTREGEESPVLEAFQGVLKHFPAALLILVPRHPERFPQAVQLARASGLSVHLWSAGLPCPASVQCLVVDAMGELLQFYAACDVAFVGGSLVAVGGHNMLEPAALSVPVLLGPHTFNFAEISRELLAAGGAKQVLNAAQLEHWVCELLGDAALRQRMGSAGLALVAQGQGALARTLEIADRLLADGRSASLMQ